VSARCARWGLALLVLAAAGCAADGGSEEGALALSAAHPPLEREPGALTGVQGVEVVGRLGPGEQPFEVARRTPDAPDQLSRRIGVETFDLALRVRRPELTQYPCTSCHLGEALALGVDRIGDAHRDLRPVHPSETGATCGTCHSAADVEHLVLFSGETVAIDHSYRLCAQCHFDQLNSWAGGGHGKRLDGWHGRRVVMGCADCHDPHAPALEPRVPYPGPTLPRTGGSDR
jgi:hypothetical protein